MPFTTGFFYFTYGLFLLYLFSMDIRLLTGGWFKKTKEEQTVLLDELKESLESDMEKLGLEYDLLHNQISKLQHYAEEQEDYESAYVLGELNKKLKEERDGL